MIVCFPVAFLLSEIYIDFLGKKSLRTEIESAQKKGVSIERMTKFAQLVDIPSQTNEANRIKARTCKAAILAIEQLLWSNCTTIVMIDRQLAFKQGISHARDAVSRSGYDIQTRFTSYMNQCDIYKFETLKKKIYPKATVHSLEYEAMLDDLQLHFSRTELPDSIRVSVFEEITDVPKFVNSHLSMCRANEGNYRFEPYLDRLQELKITLSNLKNPI